MPHGADIRKIDRSALPVHINELRARFNLQMVNNKFMRLVLYPDWAPELEPAHVRYVGWMKFIQSLVKDGSLYLVEVEGVGQIVITGQRIIGVITDGRVGKSMKLNEDNGTVFTFAFDLDESAPVEIQKNWFGKPSAALFRAKDLTEEALGQNRAFALRVFRVEILLKDNGEVLRIRLPVFLEHLTPEGRQSLQKPSGQ